MEISTGGAHTQFRRRHFFKWTGGYIAAAAGDVTNLGTINLAGPNEKGFSDDGTLDNYGTIIQTGAWQPGFAQRWRHRHHSED